MAVCLEPAGSVAADLRFRRYRSAYYVSAGFSVTDVSGPDPALFERQYALTFVHRPVLVDAVREGLALRPGLWVLDATLGLGGHAEAILGAIGPFGHLVGLDRDREALELARGRLERFGEQGMLLHGNFGELAQLLDKAEVGMLDAVLFDLGVSSMQLEKGERGFSFAREGPLDMRMDQEEWTTAADVVNKTPLPALTELIRSFGQERWAGRIARSIVRDRLFSSTAQLAETIRRAVPGKFRHGRIDPATRTFQAIRIVVNQELDLLPAGLHQAIDRLRPGGRIAVLAYHSLEDRSVKEWFREGARAGRLQVITRKPIRPSEEEVAANPRSRSACLRVAERL